MLLLLFHFKIGIVIWLRTGRRRAAQGAQPPAMSVPLGLGYSLPHFRFNYKIRLSQTFSVCARQKHTFCLSTANKYDFCRTEVFFYKEDTAKPLPEGRQGLCCRDDEVSCTHRCRPQENAEGGDTPATTSQHMKRLVTLLQLNCNSFDITCQLVSSQNL